MREPKITATYRAPKHTPGPWGARWDEERYAWVVESPDYGTIVLLHPQPVAQVDDREELEANAHLIAAAPKLLEALELFRDWWTALPLDRQVDKHDQAHAAITAARDAIAIARNDQ